MKYSAEHILTNNIVRRQTRSLHRHFAEQCRSRYGMLREVGGATWIQVHPALPVRAWLSEPDVSADSRVVDALIADVRKVRPTAEIRWLLYRPPEQSAVRTRLEEAGFELRVDCPGMTCAPGDTPGQALNGAARVGDGAGARPESARGAGGAAITVAEVGDSREARVWTSIYTQSNGHPTEAADAFAQALPEAWQARTDSVWFLGYAGGRPVTCAKLRIEPDGDARVAGLYQLATLPDVRGRGYGAALMRELMARAREIYGVDTFVLQAEPKARSLYERLGFRVDSIMAVYILSGLDSRGSAS
ncbi:MAG: GNAT family N-acetyltransferase [Spirochaetales bacterium]